MSGGLLVAHKDVIEHLIVATRIIVKSIEGGHYGSTRIAEDGLDTLVLKGTHQGFCSCYLFHKKIGNLKDYMIRTPPLSAELTLCA